MTDRADDLARRLVRVLRDGDDNPGIDIAGTWFECATDEPADVQASANDIITKWAAALRDYAEEERQACAKTLEMFPPTGHSSAFVNGYALACRDGAAAIRARGEK